MIRLTMSEIDDATDVVMISRQVVSVYMYVYYTHTCFDCICVCLYKDGV